MREVIKDVSEVRLKGLAYLDAVTSLLQRSRCAHATAGLYEAAELQWWWAQRRRPTDDEGQPFWFDEFGQPFAAVIRTAFGEHSQFDPLLMPGATTEETMRVVQRGLIIAREAGIVTVQLEVDPADAAMHSVLTSHGFVPEVGAGLVES